MTLVLEVEYLAGVSFAAIGPDSMVPDWPPQPDRLFSALAATWAARGQQAAEADALRWLERQPPPRILASLAEARSAAIVFVPPNDPRSGRRKHALGVVPSMRNRQPRRFPVARPERPVIHLLWANTEVDEATRRSLESLARDTAYVGHSSSLTRCRFILEEDRAGLESPETAAVRRRIYPGRLAELITAFEAGRRPLPGAPATALPEVEQPAPTVFASRWLLLEHVDGRMPDLRACAIVAKALRDALLSGYRQIGIGDDIPAVVSGHSPDGAPARDAHLAIVPLAFVGFAHADGRVLGYALVPPVDCSVLEDETFRRALRQLAPIDPRRGRRCLTVTTGEGTPPDRAFSVALAPTFEVSRRSLDPLLYTRPARTFATLTPIVLDRHLKKNGDQRQQEIRAQIAMACRRIGLPEPVDVVPDKHSAVEGVPSAYPSGTSPRWTGWRLPSSVANRQLTHAVIRFAVPVAGPVILGAGRFTGLGLCRALDGDS